MNLKVFLHLNSFDWSFVINKTDTIMVNQCKIIYFTDIRVDIIQKDSRRLTLFNPSSTHSFATIPEEFLASSLPLFFGDQKIIISAQADHSSNDSIN